MVHREVKQGQRCGGWRLATLAPAWPTTSSLDWPQKLPMGPLPCNFLGGVATTDQSEHDKVWGPLGQTHLVQVFGFLPGGWVLRPRVGPALARPGWDGWGTALTHSSLFIHSFIHSAVERLKTGTLLPFPLPHSL